MLAAAFTMTSCSGDEDGTDSSGLTATLQQNKWVHENFDDLYGDDWVLSDQETTTLYFVNDHQCVVYYFRKSYDSDDGTSYTRKGETVTYSVSGSIITISSSQYTASRTLTYTQTALTDQNGGVYERQSLSSSDNDIINKYYRNTDFQDLDDVINENISVTSEYSNFAHHVEITTKLSKLYPSNDITYGVEYGYSSYQYERSFGTNGNSYSEEVSVCLDNNEMYYNSITALNEKLASGKTLTADEQSLLNGILKKLKNGATSFKGRIFIEIEGERYYVYDLPEITSTQVDEDVAKNYTENNNDDDENNDNGNSDDSGNETETKVYDKETYSYKIDGVEYKMILVDSGTMPAFRIMQTELPISSYLQIGDNWIEPLSANDDVVIKAEYRTFIDNIRETTGTPFRLPTREEWMLAARGGNPNSTNTYSGDSNIENVAWYKGNSSNILHNLATKEPNELGIYDMCGNYGEMCNGGEGLNGIDYNIDGLVCGGSYKDAASDCKITSYKQDSTSGKMYGTKYVNKNAFNGEYITIRLVYTVP